MGLRLNRSNPSESLKETISTRQAMHVQRKIVARSRNHCCPGKAISNTYSECVSVVLFSVQRAYAVLYCHLWPVCLHHTLLTLSHTRYDLSKVYVGFDFLYNSCLKYTSF